MNLISAKSVYQQSKKVHSTTILEYNRGNSKKSMISANLYTICQTKTEKMNKTNRPTSKT